MFASFNALGADFDAVAIRKSRPLEIGLLAGFDGRIKLGGADPIGITARHRPGFAAK